MRRRHPDTSARRRLRHRRRVAAPRERVWTDTSITGITLSQKQAERANALAAEQGIPNASFLVMDALAMNFPDNTFDLVWACESGEHMPDKRRYVEEMVRVLKPGGTLVIATWCQRSEPPWFTRRELVNLDYLYKEWAHPYFISIDKYAWLLKNTGAMRAVETDDWTRQTIASWRHSRVGGGVGPVARLLEAPDLVQDPQGYRVPGTHAPRLRRRAHAVRDDKGGQKMRRERGRS